MNDDQVVVITCPDDPTGPANRLQNDPGVRGAVVTYGRVIATSNRGNVAVSCVPASGSVFPVGTTTVTCTAATASCTFEVEVNDTEDPVITRCPPDRDIKANATLGCFGILPDLVPSWWVRTTARRKSSRLRLQARSSPWAPPW